MHANAPTTKEGTIAWKLAMQPGLWVQTAISTVSSAALVTQGFDMGGALSQAERLHPDADLFHIQVCLEQIEANRLSVEARMRAQQDEG